MGILKILKNVLTKPVPAPPTKEDMEDPTEACKACPVETVETLVGRIKQDGCEGIMIDLLDELKNENSINYLLSTPRRVVVSVIILLLSERSALGLSLRGSVTKADLKRLGKRRFGRIDNNLAKRAVETLRDESRKRFQRTPPAYLGTITGFLERVDALTQK